MEPTEFEVRQDQIQGFGGPSTHRALEKGQRVPIKCEGGVFVDYIVDEVLGDNPESPSGYRFIRPE